jgi:hypothetical protein
MKTNQKLLWGGLGLLVLIFVCCFGLLLGSALSRDKVRPTAPAALATSTPVPLLPTRTPATVVAIEPTPTNTLMIAPSEALTATPTPIVIVVTATPAPPKPPPPARTPTPVPPIQPTGSAAEDLQALVAYTGAIKPILDEGLAAAKRDGDILEPPWLRMPL